MKPVLLDLFCGAGGATKGYQEAGFYVVGVDLHLQPNYCGDEFVQADAVELLKKLIEWGKFLAPIGYCGHGAYVLGDIAAIHASPPCQAHSDLQKQSKRDYPELIVPTRELLKATDLPYVIENVEGAPLINPTMLCGSAFGLGVRRHRLFETNFALMSPGCSHGSQARQYKIYEHGKWILSPVARVYGRGGGKAEEHWAEAMGIHWMTHTELAQAIPPLYARHVGEYLAAHLRQTSERVA